jgi:hypothetical protein
MYSMWDWLFHEYGLALILGDPLSMMKGPCSCMNPSIEEHPGPPLNQTTRGSSVPFYWLSAKR